MNPSFSAYFGQVAQYPFTIAGTTETTIASGVSGCKLVPLSGYITCGGGTAAVTIKDTDGTALAHGTAGGLLISAGIVWNHNPHGAFSATATGKGIKIQGDNASATVAGCLTCVIEKQSYMS